MRIRRWRRWAVLITTPCAIAALAFWLLFPRDELLPNATPVPNATGVPYSDNGYFWSSPIEVIRVDTRENRRVVASRVDVTNGRETDVNEDSPLLGAGPFPWGQYARLSPDCRLVLQYEHVGNAGSFRVLSPDGRVISRTGTGPWPAAYAWQGDSRGWIAVFGGKIAQARFQGSGRPIPLQGGERWEQYTLNSQGVAVRDLGDMELGGAGPHTTLWPGRGATVVAEMNRAGLGGWRKPQFAEIGASGLHGGVHAPILPRGAQVVCDAVSPQGDRIAWAALVNPGVTAWQRLLAYAYWFLRLRIPIVVTARSEIWVTDLYGRNVHKLTGMQMSQGREWIRALQWTPDGRRISFVYEDSLYTVPAD